MWSWKRHLWGWLVVAGILSVGAGTASATTQLHLTITPATVRPGGEVTLRLITAQRSCRLSIADDGRIIYRVTIRRGRIVLPFSANSAAGRLVLRVRCGHRTVTRHVSVRVPSPRGGAPAPPQPPARPAPSTPTVTAPPVTVAPSGPPPAPAGGAGSPAAAPAAGAPTTPTAAETAAVTWASRWLNAPSPAGFSVAFTYLAYDVGAGIDLRQHTSGVTYTLRTDAQDIWGHTEGGTAGTGTPPFGALVFFDAKSGENAEQASRVALMGADGEMIATPDDVNGHVIHEETLAQAGSAGSPSQYVGWWLPDG